MYRTVHTVLRFGIITMCCLMCDVVGLRNPLRNGIGHSKQLTSLVSLHFGHFYIHQFLPNVL